MPLRRKPSAGRPLPATPPRDIAAALQSTNPDERWQAARAAADCKDLDTALANTLRLELDPQVREAILTSLARLGTAAAVDSILALLRSADANPRNAALAALQLLDSLPDVLPRLLSDSDVNVRIMSCELARRLDAAVGGGMLCELLGREGDVNVCAAAIDVLAEVGGPEALEPLNACAQRFRTSPFLVFAVKTVVDRIQAVSLPSGD